MNIYRQGSHENKLSCKIVRIQSESIVQFVNLTIYPMWTCFTYGH